MLRHTLSHTVYLWIISNKLSKQITKLMHIRMDKIFYDDKMHIPTLRKLY